MANGRCALLYRFDGNIMFYNDKLHSGKVYPTTLMSPYYLHSLLDHIYPLLLSSFRND